jgi:hypothetical protein
LFLPDKWFITSRYIFGAAATGGAGGRVFGQGPGQGAHLASMGIASNGVRAVSSEWRGVSLARNSLLVGGSSLEAISVAGARGSAVSTIKIFYLSGTLELRHEAGHALRRANVHPVNVAPASGMVKPHSTFSVRQHEHHVIVEHSVSTLRRRPTDAPKVHSPGFHLRQNFLPCSRIVEIKPPQGNSVRTFDSVITCFDI